MGIHIGEQTRPVQSPVGAGQAKKNHSPARIISKGKADNCPTEKAWN